MITLEKISIYNKFGGDIDDFSRFSKLSEQNLIDDSDWSLIEEFIQNIKLISEKLSSKEYNENTLRKMTEKCDSQSFEYLTSKITI